MTVDGLSNSLRWDDLRELVKEEFGETLTPPATQLHGRAPSQQQHGAHGFMDDFNNAHAQHAIAHPAAPSAMPSYHGHVGHPPVKHQEWRVSPGMGRNVEHQPHTAREWQNHTPQIRAPLLQRQMSYPQDYRPSALRNDSYQRDGRENDRGELSNTPRYYVQQRVAPAQFSEAKAKSTGSFFLDQNVSASESRSRTEELNNAVDDRFAYRVTRELPDPHGANQVTALRNITMEYHEHSRPQQRPVSEPSSPSAASGHQPIVYRPSRSFSFSQGRTEEEPVSALQAEESLPAQPPTPTTPKRPVVHQVKSLATLKDRIDQQIREFEVDFQSAHEPPKAEDEQQLSGQASTDPDCVRDQLLLIGEEESGPKDEVVSAVATPRERGGAMSPSSQEVYIPMLQADALDGWAANDGPSNQKDGPSSNQRSNVTASTDQSPFSASSEHYITTIQFREGTEWVPFEDEKAGSGQHLRRAEDASCTQPHVPSPGRYSNATTHIPSQHSNATSSSGHSLFSASSSQGINVRESSEWVPFNDEDDEGLGLPAVQVDEVSPEGTIRSADSGRAAVGDVGISVIVEVGSGAGFLRVSDVAPDSSAEASGDVRRGDIVISADGTDLTGTDAVLRGFTKAIQGPVGTPVSLCLMDPHDMRPRNLRLCRTPKAVTPVSKFAQRQRQLVASLQALNTDPHSPEALASSIMRLRAPEPSGVVPKVLVIGNRAHGRSSLVTSLLSLLAGVRTRPSALDLCGLRKGDAMLGVSVDAVVERVGRDQQPMEITIGCALDDLETDREAETVLTALMSGKYGLRETIDDRRERTEAGEDTTVTTAPAHVVVLVQDCRVSPRPEMLRLLRSVTRECGNLPVVVAMSKMEDAALYCTDVEGLVARMAQLLSKTSFFPVALGGEGHRGEGMCRDASRMAVLELFERVRSLGAHHAQHGHREATWQQSCDFYM